MKQNVASQIVSAQMVSTTDGSDVTSGTCNVAVEIDGTAGTGGTATHIANGKWEYTPIQADTNGSYLTFQFVITGAVTSTVQVYTTFPQTVDNETRLATIETDTADLQANQGSWLTATGFNTATPLTASGVRTAVGLATANMDTQFAASATATGFNVVVPDAAGVAPTAVEIRTEMDSNSTELAKIGTPVADLAADIAAIDADVNSATFGLSVINDAVGNIAVGSSAISVQAESYLLTTGTQSSGTVSSTETLDGIDHEHTDTGGAMDLYYQFDVTGSGTASAAEFTGRMSGGNDDLDGVYAYDWGNTTWDKVGDLNGKNNTTDDDYSYSLLVRHTGTGANLGKVRIRFAASSGLTSATLFVDRIAVSYAVVSQSVGYAGGAIWIDTNLSNTNTESYVDGVADNPVSTWAAALTLSAALNIKRFEVVAGSAITLTANSDNYYFHGQAYTMALGGQSIDGAFFFGAIISGTGTSTGTHPVFEDCPIQTCTLPPSIMRRCWWQGTITNNATGDWYINHCVSRVAGGGASVFNYGTAVGNTTVNLTLWSGNVQIESMGDTGTDAARIEGFGEVVEGTCTGGNVQISGNFTTSGITNLTLSDDARIDVAQVNAQADLALTDYDGPTNTEMEARTPTAAQLAYMVNNAATGMPVTFTTSGGSTTAAVFNQVDGAAGNATNDQYNGRLLVFTSGTLKGVVTDITDYVGSTTTATITAIPVAPTSSHSARLI